MNPKELGYGSVRYNSLYVPNGFDKSKKYPAVVVLPACADHTPKSTNFDKWTKLFLENGYITIMVSHLRARGIYKFACAGDKPIPEAAFINDLYDAVEKLANLDFVKREEIFAIGFSLGAMTISMSSSASIYETYQNGRPKFKAAAGLYGGCLLGKNQNIRFMFSDTNVPLLWLMGDADTETPISGCYMVKDLKKKVPGFDFHVYPGMTHCWDCEGLNGFTKIHKRSGAYIKYVYDESVTKDSEKRVLNFFKSFETQN